VGWDLWGYWSASQSGQDYCLHETNLVVALSSCILESFKDGDSTISLITCPGVLNS